jgi:hypothetical protein
MGTSSVDTHLQIYMIFKILRTGFRIFTSSSSLVSHLHALRTCFEFFSVDCYTALYRIFSKTLKPYFSTSNYFQDFEILFRVLRNFFKYFGPLDSHLQTIFKTLKTCLVASEFFPHPYGPF